MQLSTGFDDPGCHPLVYTLTRRRSLSDPPRRLA
jgi:hypothetical protein